jgi:hypothetical protein
MTDVEEVYLHYLYDRHIITLVHITCMHMWPHMHTTHMTCMYAAYKLHKPDGVLKDLEMIPYHHKNN